MSRSEIKRIEMLKTGKFPMSDSNEVKPRQFWIALNPHGDEWIAHEDPSGHFDANKLPSWIFPVVEKSAYDALALQLAEAKELINIQRDFSSLEYPSAEWDRYIDLCAKLGVTDQQPSGSRAERHKGEETETPQAKADE